MPEPDEAFVVLWDAHYDDVLGYAVRRVDHETARDVAARLAAALEVAGIHSPSPRNRGRTRACCCK